jgi:predicted acylesterase/phospholipase RssA
MMDIIDNMFGNETLYPQNEKNTKTKLNIGIANVLNGTFVSFNDNFKTKDLLHALKASISYPGIFAPHKAWNSTWFSGSAIWNNDVSAPVLRCKAMGFKEEDIILDVIVDNDPNIKTVDASKYNAI